jgi:hypothetical protein
MVKVNGKVVRPKPKAPKNIRTSHIADEKYTGTEPVWDTERAEQFDDSTFEHYVRKSLNYYNYHFSQKDLKKFVNQWVDEHEDFDDEEKNQFAKVPDRGIEMTVCGLIMAHKNGMPFREKHLNYVKTSVRKAIVNIVDDEPEVVDDTPKVVAPTIQDRLNEKTAETIGELEGHFDEVTQGTVKFKHYDFFTTYNVPQSQLSKYEDMFSARKAELAEAQEGKDAQLKEGYSHYKAADFKRIIGWIDDLLGAVDQYRNVKKATKKVRAPRAVSKEKVVAKLKYAKDDKVLKLVSINPADIIGAKELWVYNTKTRKLGKYVADDLQGPIGVKGTSLTGFDEAKSVCKTLRKPEEKLKEFTKATKVQLRKFLEDIKATETKMNGRINADVILLKSS